MWWLRGARTALNRTALAEALSSQQQLHRIATEIHRRPQRCRQCSRSSELGSTWATRTLHSSPSSLAKEPPAANGVAPRQPFTPPPVPEGHEIVDDSPSESDLSSTYQGLPRGSSAFQSKKQESKRNHAPGSQDYRPWYRSPTTLVLGFIPIFTFGLGYWQIKRLRWKVSLIEELEDKLRREPIRLPKHINLEALEGFEFRLVELQGRFDHSRALFMGPRVREGVLGYHIVVPFERSDGGPALLLNRGFVADNMIEGKGLNRRLKSSPGSANKDERVLALLPRIYPGNAFTPQNKPDKNEWFHAEPTEMASWLSEHSNGQVLPVYLEEIFDGHAGDAALRLTHGVPIGRAPTIELRNQHAVYAATWFSLSAATAVMFGILVRRGR